MLRFQYSSHTIILLSHPQYYILYFPPMHCAFSPFQQVSCTHSMFTPLRSIRSATSLPLPVMVSKFNVATLSLIFLAFFLSSFFSFLFYWFPPFLCIEAACPPAALGAQSLVTVVVIRGLDRFGTTSDTMKSNTTRIENIWLGFTPDALPVATLPIYPGLGPAPKAALI